jgi:hypothetical protein
MLRALPPLGSLALRFTLVGITLLALGGRFETAIVKPLVPAMAPVVGAVGSEFTILDVAMNPDSKLPVVRFRADLSRAVVVNGHVIQPLRAGSQPGGWYEVALTTGGILQQALLLLIVVLAWPARWRVLALRVLLAMPVAVLLVMQHVAVTVLAELWFPFHDALAPAEIWPLLAWSRFLMGGGGLGLAVGLAALVIGLASRLERLLDGRAGGALPSQNRQGTFT